MLLFGWRKIFPNNVIQLQLFKLDNSQCIFQYKKIFNFIHIQTIFNKNNNMKKYMFYHKNSEFII